MNHKATSERSDEAERLLSPAIKHTERNHLARLEKELPLMRSQNKRLMDFLRDALAFTRQSDMKPNLILATLIHDFSGIINDEPCFLPRVTGYAAKESKQ